MYFMKRKLISLSPKQFLTSIAPFAIVAIYVSVSFSILINSILTGTMTKQCEVLAEEVEYEVKQAFEPPSLAINVMAGTISRDKKWDKDSVEAIVKSTAEIYPQCSSVFFVSARDVATKNGYLITSDNYTPPAGWSQSNKPWFSNAVNAKGAVAAAGPYENDRFGAGTLILTFSRAIYDSENEFIGVVGCDISLANLSAAVKGRKVSANSHVELIDSTGVFLTNDDPASILKKNYFDVWTLGKKYTVASYLDGKVKAFTEGKLFYCVRQVGVSPWFVVIEGPTSDFTSRYYTEMLLVNIITIFIILACIGYSTWNMNRMRAKEKELGDKMYAETQNLVVAAKENAATSQDQSAAVKEIVATMEDNNALSENISTKVKDVAQVASKTSEDVADGVRYLELNVAQLHEIADANQKTIDGIKSLGDKIENVWDIVSLINSVADQTKIIAFNAELEASSAGEAGKNFHIVASEIRRLADNITDSTKEIKDRITEIQQGSDSLILASESGTVKIQEGYESAKSLEERFASIKNASEITAGSAGDITTIIQQQAGASEQILVTLRQIAAGVENFTAATENISSSSQNLKIIANELNKQNAKIAGQEGDDE